MCARSSTSSSRKPRRSSFSAGGSKKKVLGLFSSFRRKRPSMLQPVTPPTSARSVPSNEVSLRCMHPLLVMHEKVQKQLALTSTPRRAPLLEKNTSKSQWLHYVPVSQGNPRPPRPCPTFEQDPTIVFLVTSIPSAWPPTPIFFACSCHPGCVTGRPLERSLPSAGTDLYIIPADQGARRR